MILGWWLCWAHSLTGNCSLQAVGRLKRGCMKVQFWVRRESWYLTPFLKSFLGKGWELGPDRHQEGGACV